MIRLGLRLTLAGGREAITRLALIAVAVAIGVGLLLSTLAGLNAVNNQNDRYAWLETGGAGTIASATGPSAQRGTGDPLWWRLRADEYQGKLIGRVEVAATGPNSPVPPGIPELPGPGRFYASPALVRLLHTTPPAQLGDRYPGHLVGTIGSSALPSPDALVIVIGDSVADLSSQRGADLVDRISTTSPSQCDGADCALGSVGTNRNGLILILAVVTAALLFPVLIFIGAATRLSAARREQRFAAVRLAGATPRQISVIATVESVMATALGAVAGYGVFYALRPAVATIPFTGERFFTTDLSLNLPDVLCVLVGVPLGAAAAARLAVRRVVISPLGVTRRVTPRAPRVWRLVPLLAGIAELGYFAYVRDIGAGTGTDTTQEAVLFLLGVLLMMAGLVIAGPWLTMLASRLVVRRANRPATLIATRRLADNPQAAFRAVSGLVLAVFVGTCAIAIITTIAAGSTASGGLGRAANSTLVQMLWEPDARQPHDVPTTTTRTLDSIAGVTGVAVIRHRELSPPPGMSGPPPMEELAACADLARVPALGRCPSGASAIAITPDLGGGFGLASAKPMSERTWSAVEVSAPQLAEFPIDTIVVATDGSISAIEQARTVLERAYPVAFTAQTGTELEASNQRLLDEYRQLADVVILTSLPIAGCSLAVSVAGGLVERKRPFSLLRLAGTQLGVLHRVVALEAAVPLLLTAAASMGAAFLAAQLFLRAQLHVTLQGPGLGYYLVLTGGLVASLAVIGSTLPLLNRVTGPETARNE